MVPFPFVRSLGHTMLSFGFDNGDYLAVSVEVRKEKGETYAVVGGFFNRTPLKVIQTVCDIAVDTVVEQDRFLCDDSNHATQ